MEFKVLYFYTLVQFVCGIVLGFSVASNSHFSRNVFLSPAKNLKHVYSVESYFSPYWKDHESSEILLPEAITNFKEYQLDHTPKCQRGKVACGEEIEYYRRIDGLCNNPRFPHYGSSETTLSRLLQPVYDYGIMRMKSSNGHLLPNPRIISNTMKLMRRKLPERDVNVLWIFFGQFVDHDFVNTPKAGGEEKCTDCGSWRTSSACAPILVPIDDQTIPPFNLNGERKCIPFTRSSAIRSQFNEAITFEQFNSNTAFLDLSTVYGSNNCTENRLRLYHSGQLIEQKSPFGTLGLPPIETPSPLRDCRNINSKCPLTGDDRSIEQLGIMLFHVLFLREHNRLAKNLYEVNKHWSDERIFQEARKINIAQYQRIVYEDFLPPLIGKDLLRTYGLNTVQTDEFYRGYDESIIPQVSTEFATAAFRVGHTMIPDHIITMDKNYLPTGSFSLVDVFRNSSLVFTVESLFEDMARGMMATRTEAVDPVVQASLTDKLFIKNGNNLTARDLIAINIARGRDHGIPSYTAFRNLCGLKPLNSWNDLDIDQEDVNKLRKVYSNIHDIDLFVGGLTEFPIEGGLVGPTFGCIIAQQFLRSKNGDRFWFENKQNHFSVDQLREIKGVYALRKILALNLEHSFYLPLNPFNLPDRQRNPLLNGTVDIDLTFWKEASDTTGECYLKSETFRPGDIVEASPCLKCFCDLGKVSCKRRTSDVCGQFDRDEACKLICGYP